MYNRGIKKLTKGKDKTNENLLWCKKKHLQR